MPKDAPLTPLDGSERFKLYLRQSFTTPGIYIKTGFFAVHDQVTNSPPEWERNIGGFGKRVGTRQAQNLMQNSFTWLGNWALGYEPRYDRCRCDGGWPRVRHAAVRNFVTYARDEHSLRPQIASYAAAFGAGAISATWQPNNPNLVVKGYQSAITQVWVGILIYEIAEFAPDVKKMLHRGKTAPP